MLKIQQRPKDSQNKSVTEGSHWGHRGTPRTDQCYNISDHTNYFTRLIERICPCLQKPETKHTYTSKQLCYKPQSKIKIVTLVLQMRCPAWTSGFICGTGNQRSCSSVRTCSRSPHCSCQSPRHSQVSDVKILTQLHALRQSTSNFRQ